MGSPLADIANEIPYLFGRADRCTIEKWQDSAGPFPTASSCFMDATTLAAVLELVSDDGAPLRPVALADLSTFVNAVLLNERIFHVGTEGLDSLRLNEGLGNEPIVIGIPAPEAYDVQLALRHMWDHSRAYLHRIQDTRSPVWFSMQRSWIELFGEEHAPYPIYDGHILTRNFTSEAFVVKHLGLADPTELQRVAHGQQGAGEYVAINSARGLYNLLLSEALNVPYYAGAARLPVISSIADQARAVQSASILDCLFRATVDDYFRATGASPFPLLLTALLNRASTVKDLLPTLAGLRNEALGLRKRRTQIEQAAQNGDVKELAQLRTALAETGRRLALKWSVPILAAGALAVLPKVGIATVHESLILATLAVLARTKWRELEDLLRPVFRPDLSFLTSVASDARISLNTWKRATQLWRNADAEPSEFRFVQRWL